MSSQNYQELAYIQNKKIMFFCSKLGLGNNEVSNTESQGKSEYLKRLEKMKEDEYNRKVESLKK